MLSTLAVTALAATLEVEVVDDARVEVPGATVTVSGPLETAQSRVTDVAGRVRFEIPDGEGYVLQASHEALRTTTLRGVGIHGPTRMSLAMTGDDTVLPVLAERGPKRGPLVLQNVPCHHGWYNAYALPCPVSRPPPPDWPAPAPLDGFVQVDADTASFPVHVDTRSYDGAQSHLHERTRPPAGLLRAEAWVSHFADGWPVRQADTSTTAPIRVHTAGMPHPSRPGWNVARVALWGVHPARPRRHVTFLVDVSPSMEGGKLELARGVLRATLTTLGDEDTVAIATYAGTTRVALRPTRMTRALIVHDVIDALEAGGAATLDGLEVAYALAREAYVPEHDNVIVVVSDGGPGLSASPRALEAIAAHARRGFMLTTVCVGAGAGDGKLAALGIAGRGGHEHLADREALLGYRRRQYLPLIARDVEVRVERNPAVVRSWRLVGHEDVGIRGEPVRTEVYEGGLATALYEAELDPEAEPSAPALTMRVGYRDPRPEEWHEVVSTATVADLSTPDDALRLAWVMAATAQGLLAPQSAAWDAVSAVLDDARGHPWHAMVAEIVDEARVSVRDPD